ncbi:MAG: cysteine desulfurase [Bacteroidota bacterium]|nr:cysteine desulfurase [Bacteroidota bacterium]MDX5447831.1 cysteine desulfurase [Bacteroidota bacterium]
MTQENPVYLDNAATTPLAPEVRESMLEALETFGNPSSTHGFGRHAKILVEQARKSIANTLHCQPGEIFFTSGGTEADNLAIQSSVRDLGVRTIITSPLEHHAVLYPIEQLEREGRVQMKMVRNDERGVIDLDHLVQLIRESEAPVLVSLMHGNNEIGNLLDLDQVASICKENQAFFHSDTVQTFGHYEIDLSKAKVDFMTCAAHKFHGPKGIGFLFIRGGIKLKPQIWGGGQERNMRAGTENLIGIAGLRSAMETSYSNLPRDKEKVLELKRYAIDQFLGALPDLGFNGLSGDLDKSLYTVINLKFPKNNKTEMLLFMLDIDGIAVSGGSACNSGSTKGSHVIEAMRQPEDQDSVSLRVSLSRYNTKEDIDRLVTSLKKIILT